MFGIDETAPTRLAAMAAEIRSLLGESESLPATEVRSLLTSATLLYSAAVAREGRELPLDDQAVNATDAVVLACALLRGQNLNPFDLTLWFGRTNSEHANNDR